MKKIPPVITGQWTDEGGGRKDGLPDQETSAPINGKKPKSRPAESLRDKLGVAKTLPNYTGPYSVGTMEIEVPAKNPCVISNIKRKGHHLLQLETVLMVIYYPAKFGTGAGKPPSGQRKWSRETWLPKPRMQLAHGYGRFAGVGSLGIPFFTTSMLTKLRGFKNAPPAEHWPPNQNLREGGRKVKHTAGPVPDGEPEEPTFPLLMFSHGLGGSRTMYSSLCGEFASYGFVVCAVEHRDGSCPRTFVNHPPMGEGTVEEREEKGHIDHSAKERKRKLDVIDYVFPEGNKYDTAPNNSKGVDHELRDAQMQLRMAEIEEAYFVLCEIANGNGQRIAEKSLRGKGFAGGSSHGLIGIDWSAWKGRFHTSRAALMGHSFGAATVVTALRAPQRFDWIVCGVIYDIWGAAINPYDPNIEEEKGRIQKPILAINSEAFSYWPSNFTRVSSLMNEARDADVPAWFLTVRGTVHVTQTDFSILYPRICSILLKMTSDPRRALDINVNTSLEFFKLISMKNTKEISLILRSTQSEGILQTAITDDLRNLPQEELHPPNQKWIAARLRIPHEFTYRFSPSLLRKRMRRKAQHGNRGLEGFGRPGEEFWMHSAPTSEDLKRFGIPLEEDNEGAN